jgi:hypothetical protein
MPLPQAPRLFCFHPAPADGGNGAGTSGHRENLFFSTLLFLVLVLGLGLRAGHLSRPYYQRDEGVTTAVAAGLDYPQRWTTNWIYYPVPPEFHYDEFNFSSYHYLAHGWLVAAESLTSPDNRLTVLRTLNLPLALATLLFTALAARRAFGWLPGVFAAAVLAVLPILVQDSHYARCDSMLTAGVASLLWLLAPRVQLTRWHWAATGAIVGWLVACKFSLLLLGPFLLGAVIADTASRSSGWAGAGRSCGWLAFGGSLGLALGLPGAITDPHAFLRGMRTLLAYYHGFYPPYSLPGGGPIMGNFITYLVMIIGPGILALASLGAVNAWTRGSQIWITGLLLTLISSVLVFGSQRFIAERNISPFLPLLAVLAGSGLALVFALGRKLPGAAGRAGPWIATLALVMTLVPPFRLSLRMVVRGFSLRDLKEQRAFLDVAAAEAAKQKMVFASGSLVDAASFSAAEAVLREGPTVFAIFDFQDANSKEFIVRLARSHGGRVVATREGLFPGLPCCTLTTMLSARIIVLQCRPSK